MPTVERLNEFGLSPQAWGLIQGQLAVYRRYQSRHVTPLAEELRRLAAADAPAEERLGRARAELRRRVHMIMHALAPELDLAPATGSPSAMRARLVEDGSLPVPPGLLEFRRFFPGSDIGIYLANHSMGLPSVASPLAAAEHQIDIVDAGIENWDEGHFSALMEQFERDIDELMGGTGEAGRVAWCPNVSEGLLAVLESLAPRDGADTLVFTSGHFTTGHYVHHQWAANCGGRLHEVPLDPRAGRILNTEAVLSAVGPETRLVSLSHALFQSGYLQDLAAIARGLAERAPHAVLVVDVYQTAGTVPLDLPHLAVPVIAVGGAHKQLRASAGAAFIWVGEGLMAQLQPRRAGWWGHARPFGFEFGPIVRPDDVTALRTGTPTLAGMQQLVHELALLRFLGGGDLRAAIGAVRAHTSAQMEMTADLLRRHGAEVVSPAAPEERAGFLCVHHTRARLAAETLLKEGVQLDFRPDGTGPDSGILRFSSSATTLGYELRYLALRIIELVSATEEDPTAT